MRNHSRKLRVRCAAAALAAAMLLTACAGGAASFDKQMELGRKYLSETNYTEAIAAFTEAIRLNPDDIEAYMGRAQAYAALEKYDEAKADYTAVIEMTDGQPYQQANAYVGRAGVGEETDQLTDAESDYAAALALLGEKTIDAMDDTDAEAARNLKKEALTKHAAVCVTLVLLDKAAGDYDQLEELGQNVTAERSELEKLWEDTSAADTENGLPDSETPEQPEEPAAEEEPASSKEQAAESKQEQTAAQPQSYSAKKTEGISTTAEKVNYQIGGTTIRLTHNEDSPWTDEGVQHLSSSVNTYVYTLSQPLQAMERKGDWQVIWDVPAGTTISRTWSYSVTSDAADDWETSGTGITFLVTTRVLSETEVEDWNDISSSESVTIEKGKLYQIVADTQGGILIDYGGFVFRGV